ncbi:MAG TPA: NAD-dependent epimerase/dehydratase family protein [Terracidiphilus sp.]|jgi:UDP-glucose 4-epimerase|nr:NAD-dependent epimerase/dehydratase family protein [Terracidiphilus sp.]
MNEQPHRGRSICVVIGGTGFIGRHLCATLVASGKSVRSLSRRGKPENPIPGVEYLAGRLGDERAVRQSLQGASTVWHLASATLPASSLTDSVTALHEEVAATVRLCEIAREEGAERLIFASSGGTVYGVTDSQPIPEDHLKSPISAYGVQKIAIEMYLQLFERISGLKSFVLRMGNPYGEDQDWNKPFGAIANFVNRAVRGLRIDIWGDGAVVRDYFHVDDLTEIFHKIETYSGLHRVFNVGSGEGASLTQVLKIIEGHLSTALDVSYGASRLEDVPYNVLDIERANKELGWTPRISLQAGIRRVLDSALRSEHMRKALLDTGSPPYKRS